MAKGTPLQKNKESHKKNEMETTEDLSKESSGVEGDKYPMGLKITCHSVEHVKSEKYPIIGRAMVYFNDKFFDCSEPFVIVNGAINKVELETEFILPRINESVMESFTNNPFLFGLELLKSYKKQADKKDGAKTAPSSGKEGNDESPSAKTASSSGKGGNDESTTANTAPNSGKGAPKKKKPDPCTLFCIGTLDVLPILLGENKIEERVAMRPAVKDIDIDIDNLPFESIPKLDVTVEVLDYCFQAFAPPFANILTITVESIYNATPYIFSPANGFIAFIPLPEPKPEPPDMPSNPEQEDKEGAQEKPKRPSKPSELVDPDKRSLKIFQFFPGKIAHDADRDFRKIWRTSPIPGRSKYRISEDVREIKNHLNVDVKEKILGTGPRVTWNTFHRICLNAETQQLMFKTLLKYKCWPVEFRKLDFVEKDKANKQPDVIHPVLCVAFLDLTNLLYPGVRATRVTGQLMTYTDYEAKKNWGLDESLGDTCLIQNKRISKPEPPPEKKKEESAKTVEEKPHTKKGKTGDKKKKGDSAPGEKEEPSSISAPRVILEEYGEPLLTPNGEPIFVIVEVELMKPLIPKKTIPELEQSIAKIIPQRKVYPAAQEQLRSAQKGFVSAIRLLTDFINQEYKDYRKERERTSRSMIDLNDEEEFSKYLHKSGGHTWIKETLQEKLLTYVRHKYYQYPVGMEYTELQNYLCNLYCILVDEMHGVVNEMVDGDRPRDKGKGSLLTSDELLLFANEAIENGDLETAKKYLLKRIQMSDLKDPNDWLDLAVAALRFNDGGYALECLKEVLALDSRHKDGLLVYAVLLTMAGDFEASELFFNALLEYYPRFLEGWISFHMLYLIVEKPGASDITLLMGTKCAFDLPSSRSSLGTKFLTWYIDKETMKGENVFLRTAIYLLRFNLHEMAQICLAQDFSMSNEASIIFSYYMAVCHYSQGKYEESNSHLENAINVAWKDKRLWTLMGHNYWRLGNKEKASHCYQFVVDLPCKQHDIFLTFVRMGYYKLEDEEDQEAKTLFLRALKRQATPAAWIGLGISCYMLEQYEDAELALCEANMMDNEIPDIWAYLALINLKLKRKDQFIQCMVEARKFNLKNEKVIERIKCECQSDLGKELLQRVNSVTHGKYKLKLLNDKFYVWYVKPDDVFDDDDQEEEEAREEWEVVQEILGAYLPETETEEEEEEVEEGEEEQQQPQQQEISTEPSDISESPGSP